MTKQALTEALAVLKKATSFSSKKARDRHAAAISSLEVAIAAERAEEARKRAAFEAWALDAGFDTRRHPPGFADGSEDYIRSGTGYAWAGWQAARS